MKIKVFLLTIFMLLFLTGCSLFGEVTKEPTKIPTIVETEDPLKTHTPTPTPEPVELIDIYVKNTEELYCNVGEAFKPSKLSVIAKYSDDSEVNVTDESTFSTILTNTIGKKELTITYENKTIKVLVDILKPIGLELDIANTKTQYEIGDVIDISGLKVYNTYENQDKKNCTSYIIRIENQNGEQIPVNSTFDSNGVYNINVVSGNFVEEYEIIVGEVDIETEVPIPDPDPTPEVVYVELELDLENVKRDFYDEEEFNYNNLIVYALKSDGSKEVIPSTDYKVELEEEFVETKEYTVHFTYIGNIDFENKELIYFVNYTITNETEESTFNITMSYSGYSSYEEFEIEVTSESVPEDFIRTENGYIFAGFSEPFSEWKEGSVIKIYLNKVVNGKCDLIFMEEDYTYVWYKTFNVNSAVNRADYDNEIPYHIPEGFEFLYWNLEETFTITETMYTMPIFVPEGFEAKNLTEEATVNNVSANAVDVNVEEFLNATPEGYSLDSITLGLNGEVLYKKPYEEGMVRAYFTNLTVDTEYEVGAYYSQNQATTLAFRKTRQLTYRFHFVGFMIVTKGDVLHRVRMMYQGDVLYRWYYSPDTYVSNYHFFYDFQLPIEYDGYECVGCEEVVGYITQDIDLEVVLIKKDDNYCTVVFYSGEYINGDLTILKTEVVPKGGTATPPSVPDYDDGRYLYRFDYWNGHYSNVTENEFVYAQYKMEPLFVPQVYMNVIVGDTYCYIFGESDTPELWLLCKYELYDVASNEMLEDGFTEIDYSNKFLVSSQLQPGKEYVLTFGYFTQERLPINVMANTYECAFTTRLGIEKTNYTFTTSSTPYSFKINEAYSDVIMYMQRLVEDDGSLGTPSIVSSGYLCQNLSFCVNPVLKGDVDYSYFVYFDDIMVSTLDAVIPTIENAQITNTQGEITVYGNISDPTEIVRYVQLVYKTTDNSNYITKTCNITGNTSINFDLTIDLSVVDPDTGITHYYEISEAYLSVVYIYNGNGSNKIKHVFDVIN